MLKVSRDWVSFDQIKKALKNKGFFIELKKEKCY
ncbi:hypothetical protein MED121_18105 [Marinomonas sp. MED121]|nr:hypothetical protein MED121_18105 [Marinomonas sp. MED121]